MGDDDRPGGSQLPHLDTFSAVAESSSFSAAAKVLGVTQSAVSQRVQSIEKRLGQPLFRRTGGKVLLTGAGRRLYSYAQKILDLHRQAVEEITGHTTVMAGELRLAASSIPGEHLLPALLCQFQHRHPHVRVRAGVSDSVDVIYQVEHGRVSVGLVGARTGSQHLEFRPFATDRMVLVAPSDPAWAGRKQISVRQLRSQPLILREKGSGTRTFFEQAVERAGASTSDLRVVLELGSNQAIKDAVARGMGLAVLSARAVQRESEAGALRCLTVKGLPSERELFVAWDRRRVLPAAARSFLYFLESNPASPPRHKCN